MDKLNKKHLIGYDRMLSLANFKEFSGFIAQPMMSGCIQLKEYKKQFAYFTNRRPRQVRYSAAHKKLRIVFFSQPGRNLTKYQSGVTPFVRDYSLFNTLR